MSIEKLCDSSRIHVESNPYTQILNTIIQHITDNDAFRLYVYLISKTREWNVVKEWTAKQCNVSERKAKQCWSYLERCGLLEYMPVRNKEGKFIKHDVRILNGTRFNKDEPFIKPTGAESAPVVELSTENDTHRCNNALSGETTRVGFAPLLKKDITKEGLKALRNKEKSFCENEQKKHIQVSGAITKPKNRRDYDNKQKHSWAGSVRDKTEYKNYTETRSTVKEWGPGHPDYDRMHA